MAAIQSVKTAFLIRLGAQLKKHHKYESTATEHFLDVTVENTLFRIYLHVVRCLQREKEREREREREREKERRESLH